MCKPSGSRRGRHGPSARARAARSQRAVGGEKPVAMPKNPGANITSAVRETLDSVVTPSVRNAILDRALRAARRAQLPTDPQELDAFVQGPLHDTLVQSLGQQLGESVAAELERIVAVADRSVTPVPSQRSKLETVRPGRSPSKPKMQVSARPSRSTMPSRSYSGENVVPPGSAVLRDKDWAERERRGMAPTLPATKRVVPPRKPSSPKISADTRGGTLPARAPSLPTSADYPRGTAKVLGVIDTRSLTPKSEARPVVLVASTDAELVRTFQAWLELRATVEPITGASALLARLPTVETRAVVLLDGKNPGIRPLTLAALAEEFPKGVEVVLWGVPTHVHARMCGISALAERWLVCGGSSTADEVVAECAKILG